MSHWEQFGRDMTRRGVLERGAAFGALTLAGAAFARAAQAGSGGVDLGLPGGPSDRPLTRAFPQKGEMILQRMRPTLLETPFEVFDRVPAGRSATWILPALYASLGVLVLTLIA